MKTVISLTTKARQNEFAIHNKYNFSLLAIINSPLQQHNKIVVVYYIIEFLQKVLLNKSYKYLISGESSVELK